MDVFIVVFDRAAFDVSEKLLGEVACYIDQHYVDENKDPRRELLDVERAALSAAAIVQHNVCRRDGQEACLFRPFLQELKM